MTTTENLIGYATIFGKSVIVYGPYFGEANAINVTLKIKNKTGSLIDLDSRYFQNRTEYCPD